MLGAAVAVAVELRSENGRARLLGLIAFSLRCSQRLTRRPKGGSPDPRPGGPGVGPAAAAGDIHPGPGAAVGVVNWWADVGCLVFAMGLRASPASQCGKILLVWTAGAGAASLSPTPAGIGAVEVAMVAALAAAGVKGFSRGHGHPGLPGHIPQGRRHDLGPVLSPRLPAEATHADMKCRQAPSRYGKASRVPAVFRITRCSRLLAHGFKGRLVPGLQVAAGGGRVQVHGLASGRGCPLLLAGSMRADHRLMIPRCHGDQYPGVHGRGGAPP